MLPIWSFVCTTNNLSSSLDLKGHCTRHEIIAVFCQIPCSLPNLCSRRSTFFLHHYLDELDVTNINSLTTGKKVAGRRFVFYETSNSRIHRAKTLLQSILSGIIEECPYSFQRRWIFPNDLRRRICNFIERHFFSLPSTVSCERLLWTSWGVPSIQEGPLSLLNIWTAFQQNSESRRMFKQVDYTKFWVSSSSIFASMYATFGCRSLEKSAVVIQHPYFAPARHFSWRDSFVVEMNITKGKRKADEVLSWYRPSCIGRDWSQSTGSLLAHP